MSYKIKDLPKDNRPRERLASRGSDSLSILELLEILISQGNGEGSAFEIAQNLILRFPSLQNLFGASSVELRSVPGIGHAKCSQLKAAFEIGKRFSSEKVLSEKNISSPEHVYMAAKGYLDGKTKEHLMLFCLNSRNMLIENPIVVSMGVLNLTLVHPREIYGPAIKSNSASIIVVHNHPSGDPSPSDGDLSVTRKLFEAGEIVGISLVDHVIVCRDSFLSLRMQYPRLFKND